MPPTISVMRCKVWRWLAALPLGPGMQDDSSMIIGRNFDFFVGDKFAEDKIVAFFNPSNGS